MYKKTHQANQGRADGTRTVTLQGGEEKLTDDERLAFLIERVQILQQQIKTLPFKSRERKQMGVNIASLNYEINKLRGRKKESPGIGAIFLDVAFRKLPKEQYDALMAEARHIYDVRYKMKRKTTAAKHAAELGAAMEKIAKANSTRDSDPA